MPTCHSSAIISDRTGAGLEVGDGQACRGDAHPVGRAGQADSPGGRFDIQRLACQLNRLVLLRWCHVGAVF